MKRRSIIIRFLAFLVMLAALLTLATAVLKDKRVELEYDVTAKVKGFYAQEEHTLDFVFVGSSQLYADIAPNVLFEEFGMTAYDFCANEQPLWISYYYIREALKHQTPKAIVLDVFTVYGDDYEENGVNHINLDDLPWNLNKMQAIWDAVPAADRGEFYFELAAYHDTWDSLDAAKIQNSFYHEKNVYRGYSPFVVRHDYAEGAPQEVTDQHEVQPIPDKTAVWLDRIVELTRQEGVDLILIKTPNGNADRQRLYNAVQLYADEKGLPFVNMNLLFDGEAHINILQAERVTRFMGQYLADRYEIADKRNDPAYASWHEDSRYFYQKKAKCQLISTDQLEEYVSLLRDSRMVTLLAVRADQTHPVSAEAAEQLSRIGIATQEGQTQETCILAMLDENADVLEQYQTQEAQSCCLEYAGHSWELAYDPENEKRKTVLGLDGENYSWDAYGINIFVYDTLLEEIVEFAVFDGEQGSRMQVE